MSSFALGSLGSRRLCARAAATCSRRSAARSSARSPIRSSTTASAAAGPSDVFVLDVDGTLVDSEPEVSSSAYHAAADHWPQLFSSLSVSERERVLRGLRLTRPRLVKGFEAMVMARLILQEGDSSIQRILDSWEDGLLPATLAAWQAPEAELAAAFERYRAAQLSSNRQAWLALNQPYQGVADALRDCPYPWYVVSSKAASRLVPLLNSTLGLEEGSAQAFAPDSPRVYASLIPPNERKIEALRAIAHRPVAQGGATLHFVDDRLETLRAIVEQAPDLANRYRLYLATWGYCTEEEKAKAVPGVRHLALQDFCELLRWGVVMGVDDGCEPTAEEVLAGLRGE